jgi:AcrR family transcriptional regulator
MVRLTAFDAPFWGANRHGNRLMAQKTRTRLSKEGRRSQLLDTTAAIIEDLGFSGFTMETLAKTAGVSNPLVYKYFDSRQEIFKELLLRELEDFRLKMRAKVVSTQSFEDLVRVFVEANFEQSEAGNVRDVLLSQPDLRDAVSKTLERNHKETGRYLIERVIESNRTMTLEQAEHLLYMGSAASVAAAEKVNRSGRSRQRLIDNTVSFILGGFAAPYADIDSDTDS